MHRNVLSLFMTAAPSRCAREIGAMPPRRNPWEHLPQLRTTDHFVLDHAEPALSALFKGTALVPGSILTKGTLAEADAFLSRPNFKKPRKLWMCSDFFHHCALSQLEYSNHEDDSDSNSPKPVDHSLKARCCLVESLNLRSVHYGTVGPFRAYIPSLCRMASFLVSHRSVDLSNFCPENWYDMSVFDGMDMNLPVPSSGICPPPTLLALTGTPTDVLADLSVLVQCLTGGFTAVLVTASGLSPKLPQQREGHNILLLLGMVDAKCHLFRHGRTSNYESLPNTARYCKAHPTWQAIRKHKAWRSKRSGKVWKPHSFSTAKRQRAPKFYCFECLENFTLVTCKKFFGFWVLSAGLWAVYNQTWRNSISFLFSVGKLRSYSMEFKLLFPRISSTFEIEYNPFCPPQASSFTKSSFLTGTYIGIRPGATVGLMGGGIEAHAHAKKLPITGCEASWTDWLVDSALFPHEHLYARASCGRRYEQDPVFLPAQCSERVPAPNTGESLLLATALLIGIILRMPPLKWNIKAYKVLMVLDLQVASPRSKPQVALLKGYLAFQNASCSPRGNGDSKTTQLLPKIYPASLARIHHHHTGKISLLHVLPKKLFKVKENTQSAPEYKPKAYRKSPRLTKNTRLVFEERGGGENNAEEEYGDQAVAKGDIEMDQQSGNKSSRSYADDGGKSRGDDPASNEGEDEGSGDEEADESDGNHESCKKSGIR
ncbi:hypothetical protein BDN72DRAFT_857921 [Pluteus cervinus]|uniref:Uncharacterized protein n=1 Tax=Pluteus cervinus TaxID=181527 RepID=A0ACD3ATV3_9AGAR|nr:hypothetical protein BDN72DRAFT_857921 [Pluteus cervinus]